MPFCTAVCDALCTDQQVEQLWLKRNPLLPAGTQPIASMLRTNTYLQVLDLTNTGILDDGTKTIMDALGSNSGHNVQYLYLDTNGITNEGVKSICQYLTSTSNKSLLGQQQSVN